MLALPLQVIDNFLLPYNVGQALLLVFVLGLLAAIPTKSRRVYGIQFVLFGLLYMLTPQSLLEANYWKFFGIALLFVGPMLYLTARR
ncbi:MAG: hypothetical protein ABEJ31_06945 [Haloarculaceae archaeon]